jgi:hypothetical protein
LPRAARKRASRDSFRPRRSIHTHVINEHRRRQDGIGARIAVERSSDGEIQDHEKRLIKYPLAQVFHVGAADGVVQRIVAIEMIA